MPWSERAREQIGQGATGPQSELARVLLADSLQGANWLGSEKARYQIYRVGSVLGIKPAVYGRFLSRDFIICVTKIACVTRKLRHFHVAAKEMPAGWSGPPSSRLP